VTIYHVEFAKTGTGVSGGEKAMAETIKYLAKKSYKNVLLTTDNAQTAYSHKGVIPNEAVAYKTIPSYEREKRTHIFISYLSRIPQIKKLLNSLVLDQDSIIICHSNFFPNSIAAWILSKKASNAKILYWHHTLPPKILRGYRGEFTSELHMPSLALLHYHLNQKLYERLHRKDGIILIPNQAYLGTLRRRFKSQNITVIAPYGGLDGDMSIEPTEKKFDLAWMGRFQHLKGLMDFVEIAEGVHIRRPSTKILVIGGGTAQEEAAFLEELKKRDLLACVEYKGFMNQSDRYRELSKARIMSVTSYFESYGLVNIEALKLGLPIVAYGLPTYSHIKRGLIPVDIGDTEKFVHTLISLLDNEHNLAKISNEAKETGRIYSWAATNKQIEELFNVKDV
jgi:glycosyltransferase involved in cell wall biosynthesis